MYSPSRSPGKTVCENEVKAPKLISVRLASSHLSFDSDYYWDQLVIEERRMGLGAIGWWGLVSIVVLTQRKR